MDRIDISKRLEHFRQRAEMTQRELAEKVGVSPQAVSKWESDDEWDPTIYRLRDVADAIGIAMEDLTGWYPKESFPKVGRVAAGQPSEAIALNAEDRMYAPQDIASDVHRSAFFLRVSGDSMNRIFPEGMALLVDPDEQWSDRDIVVVTVNGDDATVKRIFTAGNTVVLHPESTNPEYQDMTLSSGDDFRVIGKVVWAAYPRAYRY